MEIIKTYLSRNLRDDYDLTDRLANWDWKTLWFYNLLNEGLKGQNLKRVIDKYPSGLSFHATAYMEHAEPNKIILGDQHDDLDREFEMDKTHLFELIDKWEELAYKLKLPKIIITREDDQFTIEPAP